MSIKVTCPQCERTLAVPASDAGKAAMCNACGQRVMIPYADVSTMELGKLPAPPDPPATPTAASPQPEPPAAFTPPFDDAPPRTEIPSVRQPWVVRAAIVVLIVVPLAALAAVMAMRRQPSTVSPELTWEADHRAEIVSLIADAEASVVGGDLVNAARKYRGIDLFVADHPIADPSIRAALDGASLAKRKVLATLVERAGSALPPMPKSSPAPPSAASAVPESIPSATSPESAPPPPTPQKTPLSPATQPPAAPVVSHSFLKVAKLPYPVDPMNDERIGAAIQSGANWLMRRFDPRTHELSPSDRHDITHHGGLDALCVYALLQCGLAIHDERLDIHKDFTKGILTALDAIKMEPYIQTYGRGLRASALAVHDRKEDHDVLARDVRWLLKAHKDGAYSYDAVTDVNNWDNSNSQYGVLGVWSGAEANIEIPSAYWAAVQKHWDTCQTKEGGWGYTFDGARLSMTLAGTASLVRVPGLARRHAHRRPRAVFARRSAKALKYLEQGDTVMAVDGGYTLYGVERVGLASGFKFFGQARLVSRTRPRHPRPPGPPRRLVDGTVGRRSRDGVRAALPRARPPPDSS